MDTKSGVKQEIDVWTILDRKGTVVITKQTTTVQKPVKAESGSWGKFRSQLGWFGLDVVALLWWIYIFLQIFIFDVDQALIRRLYPAAEYALPYKFLVPVSLALIVGVFFWGWKMLGVLLYIAFYPFVILFWKIPKFIVTNKLHKSWVLQLGITNVTVGFFRNARYHLVTKALAFILSVIILCSTTSVLLAVAGVGILAILLVAAVRLLSMTFHSNAFTDSQRGLLTLAKKIVEKPIDVSSLVKEDGSLTQAQAEQVANKIIYAATLNRALYLWAYKLQQYRESNVAFLINTISYVIFFLGLVFSIFLLNYGGLKLAPNDYEVTGHASVIAVFLYSLSSLALADGGGIVPHGDMAYFFRIIAGILGPTFVLAIISNAVIFRVARDDVELRATVEDLRKQARQHEDKFREALRVGVDEACDRLVKLGYSGLIGIASWLKASLPSDFVEGDAIRADSKID